MKNAQNGLKGAGLPPTKHVGKDGFITAHVVDEL